MSGRTAGHGGLWPGQAPAGPLHARADPGRRPYRADVSPAGPGSQRVPAGSQRPEPGEAGRSPPPGGGRGPLPPVGG